MNIRHIQFLLKTLLIEIFYLHHPLCYVIPLTLELNTHTIIYMLNVLFLIKLINKRIYLRVESLENKINNLDNMI